MAPFMIGHGGRALIRKRGREWHVWDGRGAWLGCSSHWRVALALALGETNPTRSLQDQRPLTGSQ